MRLPTPCEIRQLLPAPTNQVVAMGREEATLCIQGKKGKLALLIGPCSIHDIDAALEYAARLKKLSSQLHHFSLFMRVFLEKPRTRKGWTGLIYDPHLNGTGDIALGIQMARKLLIALTNLGVPCATELLDPLIVPYFDDLISWGMIGARTAASQPHRQLASSLPFPVGFKNGIHGELDTAIYGILSAKESHSRISIDSQGFIASQITPGNPFPHLVLRGSETGTNYDAASIEKAIQLCAAQGIHSRILIDCSHGNSRKDHTLQPHVFQSVLRQNLEGVLGFMLESNLHSGKQPLTKTLRYGVSITDSCLGWEETEELISQADEGFQSIQKGCSHTSSTCPSAPRI